MRNLYKSDLVIGNLSVIFAGLAIFISCLGLLGLSIFTASQRVKEIGVRKVLGASVGSLFNLLSKEFLMLVGIAFAIAAPLGWWAMDNWLNNFAYRAPVPWWVFAISGILAMMIAYGHCLFPGVEKRACESGDEPEIRIG